MELFFSKYRISTITSNANIFIENYHENIKINLIKLFNNLSINEKNSNNNFIFTSRFCKLTNSIIERGTYIKKKRSVKSKRTFDNQISFVFKVEDNYHLNTKVFQNGNLHITGCRNIDDITKPLISLINEIKKLYKMGIDILLNEKYDIDKLNYRNIKIFMINTDFKVYTDNTMQKNFSIKRRILHNILINEYNVIARFDPSTYTGVKVEYWWNEFEDIRDTSKHLENRNVKSKSNIIDGIKKITIVVFESGSILITGGITIQQVEEAYKFICNIIRDNKDKIFFNI